MNHPSILWLDLQPSLYCFNCRLSRLLASSRTVRRWSFEHDPDESCSIATIHNLLRQSILETGGRPHLVAHGLSGTIAHRFVHQYPELIQSLTLLSVDSQISNHWTSHYHEMRKQLSCTRAHLLQHLTSLLFECNQPKVYVALAELMAKCLDSDFVMSSLISHDLYGELEAIPVPLLVLNGDNDFVVDRNAKQRWAATLKPGDCYESIANSRHFFQFHHPVVVADRINNFLDMIPTSSIPDNAPRHFLPINQSQQ